MRAVILAGGLGTRLRPYTTILPKPLVPVGDRPILEHILRRLHTCGIGEVDLCVSHLGELIQVYFSQDGTLPDGLDLRWHWEDEPLGTAGALRLVPDLPGHGESDKPRTDYTPRFFARSMRKLLEAVGAEEAVVVGNSMGGRVALELAARSPDRVKALALLSPAVPGLRVRYLLGFMKVIPTEIGVIPFPVRERLMKFVLGQLFVHPEVLTEEARLAAADEFIRIYRHPEARMAFFDSLRHVVTEPPKPFWARMERVRQPALVVWGEQDRLLPVRLAPRLAQALPNSELLVLPEVGHVPQFEATALILEPLLAFLEKAGKARTRR